MTNKIVVEIDVDLEDLIPGYIENRHKDIAQIRQALATKDFETITRIGHRMKGTGGGYGFDAISDIGAAIETKGKEKDVSGIEGQTRLLVDYLERVEVIYV